MSVANWHHMELNIVLDKNDVVQSSYLDRLYQRFPWELGNDLQKRHSSLGNSYWAVPYTNQELGLGLVMVYYEPFFANRHATKYEEKYEPHNYSMLGSTPIVPGFGAHIVSSPYETTFDFSHFSKEVLLFSDVDGRNIT